MIINENDASLAVIGMGYWGKNLVRNFYEIGQLHTICDKDIDRIPTVENQYPSVRFESNYESILSNEEIKSVAISTPAITHFQFAKAALIAGKDVFVEKPLSLKIEEGEELVSIAKERTRILMIGHILQYHPAVIKLKELVQDGDLGQIRYLYSNRVSMGKIRTEENILWSFAPHDISLILSILNEEPSETYCQGKGYLNTGVADVTMSQFRFPSGIRAHIFVSWLHPFKEQRFVIVGSRKMAVFNDTSDNKLVLYPYKVELHNQIPTAITKEAEFIEIDAKEPLKLECEHFIKCVQNRATPITDGNEGLRVLRVLNQCQDSLSKNEGEISESFCPNKRFFSHPTAVIDTGCEIGENTKIWHFSHIMKGAVIGNKCILGQNCNIDADVIIGDNVKIQNNVSIYSGVIIEDDVFLGPSCVLTNITNPRSQVVRHALYEKTILRRGATIGANATVVCGTEIGRYAFIAAGAVVKGKVPDYSLMIGNPARFKGWISRHGHRLVNPDENGIFTCPESKFRYRIDATGNLKCIDLPEEAPLPNEFSTGKKAYSQFKINQNGE